MPKVLIIEPTIVSYGDDRGGVHADPAETPEVSKDVARVLVQAGRALYTDKKDDPSRGGIYTASAEMVKAAAAMQAARKKAAALPAAQTSAQAGEGGKKEGEGA